MFALARHISFEDIKGIESLYLSASVALLSLALVGLAYRNKIMNKSVPELPRTNDKKVLPKTALISVSNKSGILTFARLLQKNGVKIFATGGTASALRDAGIKVSKVSSLSRFPEIFGGRVKTLSPYISGGILGQRDKDKAEAKENNITWIDLVGCTLYPFSDVAIKTPTHNG